MRLTMFTDYTLRVLIYLGNKGGRATVSEIAENFNVSRNHLVKVVHKMAGAGYLESVKGKNGGIQLTAEAFAKGLGDIVSDFEPDLHIVECFDREHNRCPIMGVCRLEKLLYSARDEFLRALNRHTLKDLVRNPDPRILKKLKLA
ncbi:MAG TPA: Rrf2 family transcriptional regulator [Bdellovibrionales bacterium]|nr:Rrf2 family transcriptional regulator [Bdellovibrionales bacterium]